MEHKVAHKAATAHSAAHPHKAHASLPVSVTSPVDIGRLIRELEALDEAITQLGLRHGGAEVKLPKTSHLMDQMIELHKLNLLHQTDRKRLLTILQDIKAKSPVLHVSFSADPSEAFIEKLVAWLRKEIDPQILMTVGMQPSIGAGCVVRSTNKQFDMSLRQDFLGKRQLLLEQLKASRKQPADEPSKPHPISTEGQVLS